MKKNKKVATENVDAVKINKEGDNASCCHECLDLYTLAFIKGLTTKSMQSFEKELKKETTPSKIILLNGAIGALKGTIEGITLLMKKRGN